MHYYYKKINLEKFRNAIIGYFVYLKAYKDTKVDYQRIENSVK